MVSLSPGDLTSGSVSRTLLALAAPLVAQNIVHVVAAVVDTFWLGRVGEDAVAAVGLNFPVMALLFAVLFLATTGTHILLSQRVGSDDPTGARTVAFNGVLLAIAIGFVSAGIVVPLSGSIMGLLGAGSGVAGLAALYLATVVVFVPFAGASDTIENSFVGWGDSKAALYINVTTVTTNVVLDPFLIFGWGPFPELGVQGAALATGLGYLAGFLFALALALGRRDSFYFTRSSISVDRGILRELVSVGSPVAGQHAAGQSVRVIIIAIVSVVGGSAGLAAYTVGARIASVAFVPAAGLQQAAQSMVGQNVGAAKPDRAAETTTIGIAIAGGTLGGIGVLQWLFPGTITTIFVPDITPLGFELTVQYLEILAYGYPAIGVSYALIAAFNGVSRTRTSFAIDLCKYWGIRLPIAVLSLPAGFVLTAFGLSITPGLGWGILAIFWAVTLSNVAVAIGGWVYYRYSVRAGLYDRAVERVAAD